MRQLWQDIRFGFRILAKYPTLSAAAILTFGLGIGLTDLNRRLVVSNDEDPKARPTQGDIQQFVKKVEKLKPKALGFVTSLDIFEDSFKPLYPEATKTRGEQAFKIHESHVWLLGSTSGRVKDADAREDVFDQFASFVSDLESK